MKKLILILMFVLIQSLVWSSPFLVCDPYPLDQGIVGFKGEIDGNPFVTPYSEMGGGAVIYDIGTLDDGKHNFTNIRSYNVRGESTTVPFVLPAKPSSPSNLRLSP